MFPSKHLSIIYVHISRHHLVLIRQRHRIRSNLEQLSSPVKPQKVEGVSLPEIEGPIEGDVVG